VQNLILTVIKLCDGYFTVKLVKNTFVFSFKCRIHFSWSFRLKAVIYR